MPSPESSAKLSVENPSCAKVGAKKGGNSVAKILVNDLSVCGVRYDLIMRKFSIASPIQRSYCRILDASLAPKPANFTFSDKRLNDVMRCVYNDS